MEERIYPKKGLAHHLARLIFVSRKNIKNCRKGRKNKPPQQKLCAFFYILQGKLKAVKINFHFSLGTQKRKCPKEGQNTKQYASLSPFSSVCVDSFSKITSFFPHAPKPGMRLSGGGAWYFTLAHIIISGCRPYSRTAAAATTTSLKRHNSIIIIIAGTHTDVTAALAFIEILPLRAFAS